MSEEILEEAGASPAPTDGGRQASPEHPERSEGEGVGSQAANLAPEAHPPWAETAARSERLTRLELVTDSQRIRGSLRWSQGVVGRLLDLLNYGEETIGLADVQVAPLGQEPALSRSPEWTEGAAKGWDDAPRWPYARIRKDAIAFVIPHEEPSLSAAGAPQRPLEFVEKVPHPVWLALRAFAVRGDIHLAPGIEPALVPLLTTPGFVALTDAEATYLTDPSLVWKAAVILVNAAKVEVYCPSAPLRPSLAPQ